MICLTFLEKNVQISIGNIDLFAYSVFKNIEILSDQGVVQSEPNHIQDYHYCLNCNAERMVRLTSLEKSSYFLIGNIVLFAYSILKNIEFLSDPGVVQNGPNLYPRLPVLFKL